MLEIDYCSANINAEVFSNESQCVGAAFVGQTPGGRGVCVAGEEADTMEEKVTLKKSHLGAFHRAPGSPVTPPWWWVNLVSQSSHRDPRR